MSQRLRKRGSFDTSATSTQQQLNTSCSNLSWQTVGTQPLFATGHRESIVDEVVPHFHQRRQKGEVFFNFMHRVEEDAARDSGQGPTRRSTVTYTTCGGVPYYYGYRDIGNQVENLYSVAIGQPLTVGRVPPIRDLFGSRLSDLIVETSTRVQNDRGRSDSNLWESLAEADKALGTFTGIFKSTLRTLNSRKLKTFSKDGAASYLAWRYGIKPMIQDVNAVREGLESKVGRVRKTTRAKSTVSNYAQRTVTYSGQFIVDISEQSFDTVVVRGMSLDEHVASEFENIGFSSKGLITLPWELVRYSFVYDWFANFGEFLGAMTPAFGWTQLGSCIVVDRDQRNQITAIGTRPSTGWAIDVPCSGGYTYRYYSRTRYVGLPRPAIVVKSDFRFSNLTRCADALSLLAQRVLTKG